MTFILQTDLISGLLTVLRVITVFHFSTEKIKGKAMSVKDSFFSTGRGLIIAGVIFVTAVRVFAGNEMQKYFPCFCGKHTIALWLFDDGEYPHTTLTDAGLYEYDLRLQNSGRLVEGKFGTSLRILPGPGYAVSYAGFKGGMPDKMREEDGEPSGLWGPTIAPEKLLETFQGLSWTLEFRLSLKALPESEKVVIDLGQSFEPGVTITIGKAAGFFRVINRYAGFEALCPIEAGRFLIDKWHHIAFTSDGQSGEVYLFIDGKLQSDTRIVSLKKHPVPDVVIPEDRGHPTFGFTKDKDYDWRRKHRFNIGLGQNRRGDMKINGMLDEIRLSDVVRYRNDFPVPGSFSRNYGAGAPQATVANGPELLFAPGSCGGTVKLGSRKHLFIDDALIADMDGVRLTCNPPGEARELNFRPESSAWRASVFDKNGKVYMFIPSGYFSAEGITRLRVSDDGINFRKPELGVIELEASSDNNYVLYGSPLYGSVFKDLNPAVSSEARFKLTAWVANRGIYMYVSPDGIHWRRNETTLLPLVTGGGAESFWDDQRGLYVIYIKRDSSYNDENCPGTGRRAVMLETREPYKTWPFKKRSHPYFEAWPFPAVTCEGAVVFPVNENGQVYRTRAIKYPWAPDTYLAFVWRFADDDEHRQIDLGVSRDGIHWKFYADRRWYMSPGEHEEVLSLYGLIRRGDEIWQYADYGGAHGAGRERTYKRLTQRLDGFVSLTAEESGTVTTRPLIFKGSRLLLNTSVKGSLRVAFVDEDGGDIEGYGFSDCEPIEADSTSVVVKWNGSGDVGKLAGQTIRLKFQMKDARLYAMEFE